MKDCVLDNGQTIMAMGEFSIVYNSPSRWTTYTSVLVHVHGRMIMKVFQKELRTSTIQTLEVFNYFEDVHDFVNNN